MAVMVVATTKGGAGKTTLIEAAAGEFLSRGYSVGLVDVDPSKALTRWAGKTDHPHLSLLTDIRTENLVAGLDKARATFDMVFVDVQGSENHQMLLAFGRTDLLLIPVQPSEPDVMSAAVTMGMARQAGELVGRKLNVYCILSRIPVAVRPMAVKETRAMLQEHGFPVLDTEFLDRAAFKNQTFNGGAPGIDTPGSNAALNVSAICDEILPVLARAVAA